MDAVTVGRDAGAEAAATDALVVCERHVERVLTGCASGWCFVYVLMMGVSVVCSRA